MKTLSIHQLQKEARQAWTDFDGTQEELGSLIGLNHGLISRATRKVSRKYAAAQARIISYVREVPVQRRSTYTGERVSHEWVVDP
jgi:hypothetical protein